MARNDHPTFDERINETEWLTGEIARGVRQALAVSKRHNNPVAIWEDGQVKIVSPENIPPHAYEHEDAN